MSNLTDLSVGHSGTQDALEPHTTPLWTLGPLDHPSHLAPTCGAPPHPTAGANPRDLIQVIPEARELYKPHHSRKRKIVNSKEKSKVWNKYRDSGISLGNSSSDSLTKDAENDSSSSASEEENETSYRRPQKRKRTVTYKDILDEIDDIMKDFRLTDETYKDVANILENELCTGLQKNSNQKSSLKMLPSYIRALPDGSEKGQYLALDLGGTNFRVLLVDLNGTEEPSMKSKIYFLPKAVIQGPGTMLFDYIAQCLSDFTRQEGLLGRKLPLGFTFSFPCDQDGLASATLVKWSKGFSCSGVEGKDVVTLLHEACQRRGDVDIECVALINDPAGALICGAHKDPNCRIGLIVGTGCNCCYMEEMDKMECWEGDREGPQQMILNTEWGAFGDNGLLDFIRTSVDLEVDQNSINPNEQLFEKMISGMYMGEIVRLVLVQLVEEGLIFGGEGSEELYTKDGFLTKYVSEIESDDPHGNFSNTKLVLQEMSISQFTVNDCRHVQQVCWQVSSRSAYLVGCALAGLVRHINLPEVTISVDGSLYRFHPHFHDLLSKKIGQLIRPDQKFRLILSHDGSGKGAALVAAIAQSQKDKDNTDKSNDNVNNNLQGLFTETLDTTEFSKEILIPSQSSIENDEKIKVKRVINTSRSDVQLAYDDVNLM